VNPVFSVMQDPRTQLPPGPRRRSWLARFWAAISAPLPDPFDFSPKPEEKPEADAPAVELAETVQGEEGETSVIVTVTLPIP
jgi:hypothetical protein